MPASSLGWNRKDALPVQGPDRVPPSALERELVDLQDQLDELQSELRETGIDSVPDTEFKEKFAQELSKHAWLWFHSFQPDTPGLIAQRQLQMRGLQRWMS